MCGDSDFWNKAKVVIVCDLCGCVRFWMLLCHRWHANRRTRGRDVVHAFANVGKEHQRQLRQRQQMPDAFETDLVNGISHLEQRELNID